MAWQRVNDAIASNDNALELIVQVVGLVTHIVTDLTVI